ncbi:MAG: DUF4262 domain-containing protein [Pseudonocardiaceae bacterium]
MCWTCDHPGSNRLDWFDHLRGLITTYGWAIQGVEGDRVHPPWAYTVGLTPLGRPELVVTGLALDRATKLLNGVSAHVLHSCAPAPGEQIPLRGGPLVEIVELPHPDAHLESAIALYGVEIRALQLVRADDRGRWPWERGYRGGRGGQPVLGPRAVSSRPRP